MKQIVIILTLLILTSSFAFGFLGFGEKKISLVNYIVAGPYCKEGGICNISSLTVTNLTILNTTNLINLTVINYNITGDLNVTGDTNIAGNLVVEGNTTSTWFFGMLNFSYIQNWDFEFLYNGMKSFISNDFFNKSGTLTDGKICTYDATGDIINCNYTDQVGNGTGSGSGGTDGTIIHLHNSMKQDVIWNLTESDSETYEFYIENNVIITPVGGRII